MVVWSFDVFRSIGVEVLRSMCDGNSEILILVGNVGNLRQQQQWWHGIDGSNFIARYFDAQYIVVKSCMKMLVT